MSGFLFVGCSVGECTCGVAIFGVDYVVKASAYKNRGRPASIRMVRTRSKLVRFCRSASPFCSGVSGEVVSWQIPRSFKNFFHSLVINSPPLSVRNSDVPGWAQAQSPARPSLFEPGPARPMLWALCGLRPGFTFLKPEAQAQARAFNPFIPRITVNINVSDHVLLNIWLYSSIRHSFGSNVIHRKGLPATWLVDHSLDRGVFRGMIFSLLMTKWTAPQLNCRSVQSYKILIIYLFISSKPGLEPSQARAQPKPWKWAGPKYSWSPSLEKPSPSPGFWAQPGPHITSAEVE